MPDAQLIGFLKEQVAALHLKVVVAQSEYNRAKTTLSDAKRHYEQAKKALKKAEKAK